ncbi:MAG: hypothetical protein AAB513_00980 [Patescibacteria group bacterium]
MKRKIIQDVIPPKEIRSIRNIPVPQRISKSDHLSKEETPKVDVLNGENASKKNKEPLSSPTIPALEKVDTVSRLRGTFLILGVILILGGSYFLYLFFNIGAVVTITPKEKIISVNNTFVSKKNSKENELGFEAISLFETMEKAVPTTGEKRVEKKARGEIVIYNDYNSQSQRLIKNTRFLTPEGLVFRLESSIVVPGQTKKDGKTTAGSVGVTIAADEAGEKYNVDLKDFTIPGFKGDPRYEKFYARSKTPMTGGFNGVIKTASQTDIEIARKELNITLREKIKKAISEKVPAGFILYNKALFISFETLSNSEDSNVSMKASASAIIFSKNDLAKMLARIYSEDYVDEDITSTSLNDLVLKADPKESTPWLTGIFPVSFTGTTTLIWTIDTEKLKKDLVGVPKNFVNDIFKNYIGIEKAEVAMTPAWKSVFPENADKISIKLNLK